MKFYIFDNNEEIYLDDVEVDFDVHYQPEEPPTFTYPGCSEEYEFTSPQWERGKYSDRENNLIERFLSDPRNFQEDAERQAKQSEEEAYDSYIDSQMP